MKKFRLIITVIGAVLIIFFSMELSLALKSAATPQKISCQELINKGPGKNLNITLTDYYPCSQWYVYQTNNRTQNQKKDWPYVKLYIPAVSTNSQWFKTACELYAKEGEKTKFPEPQNIRVLLKYNNVKNSSSLQAIVDAETCTGMVVNSVNSLSTDEIKILKRGYPNLDTSRCYVIEVGKKPMSTMIATVGVCGGITLFLLGIIWMIIGKKTAPQKIPTLPKVGDSTLPPDDNQDTISQQKLQSCFEAFLDKNHTDAILDNSGNRIVSAVELISAIIEGRLSYSKYKKFIGNSIDAANFYALAVSQLFKPNENDECEICHAPGNKMTLKWGAKLDTMCSDWSVKKVIAFPFLLAAHIFFIIFITKIDDSEKINFSTTHTLCKKCKPSLLREFAGSLISIFYFVIIGIAILLMIIAICGFISSFFDKHPSTFGIIVCLVGTIVTFTISIVGIIYYRRLKMFICLPEHFRIIARGPFDLLKAGKIK